MPNQLHTYDPLAVKIIFRGIEVRGIKKGTFVKVSRSTPTWSVQESADGEVTRVRSRSKLGTAEITLTQASATNRDFATFMASDELLGDGVGVFSVRDLNGLDLHTSEAAWIMQPAEGEYGEDPGDRVWKLQLTNLDTFTGGAVL